MHGARRQHRVFRPADAGDRAGPALAPVHHRGVHFLRAGGGEHRAAPGIEQRIVLERDDRAVTASSALPPAARIARPASSARRKPGWYCGLRPGAHRTAAHRAGPAMHGKRE